ncbi:MAG: 8-amino-7-oxononanoate synthase [Magnetococcales bacterium]|nr:8-amino-7-oxononanoate synthase [Magnetococcales bacterium]
MEGCLFAERYRAFATRRREAGQWRVLRPVGPRRGSRIRVGETWLVNFASNDYLGLADHAALRQRAAEWLERWGAGSGASRLVCGDLEPYSRIEERLARLKGQEAALLLNSGFQANATLLPALLDRQILGEEPLVFSDRLNHASMHHGCLAAGVSQQRYRHNDLDHLESLLRAHQHRGRFRFILSETVFSMDGDRADLPGLFYLRQRYGAFLYLDEAHATGVLGPGGAGLAAASGERADLVMGTFSKALGGFGAYAACAASLRDYLINRCSGLIYATALPPAVLGAVDAALDLLPGLEGARCRLQEGARRLRESLRGAGLDTGASSTQIVPVRVGEEETALALARDLEAEGLLVVAVRPPTVPNGGSRLRLSLSAAHEKEAWRQVAEVLPVLARARGVI